MQQPSLDTLPTDDPRTLTFNVSEIFYSIQGEGTRAGRPCTFVRLQGCKLRCSWCDTPYALDHREQMQMMTGQQILDRIEAIGCGFVEFTGGEPLEQFGTFPLMALFCDFGFGFLTPALGWKVQASSSLNSFSLRASCRQISFSRLYSRILATIPPSSE